MLIYSLFDIFNNEKKKKAFHKFVQSSINEIESSLYTKRDGYRTKIQNQIEQQPFHV